MSQAVLRTLLSFIILIPTASLFRTSATSTEICPSLQQQEVLRCDGLSFEQRHLHPHTCHPHTDACGEAHLVPHTPPGGGASGKLREFLFLSFFRLASDGFWVPLPPFISRHGQRVCRDRLLLLFLG